jgi:mediator of RNA polymerase II transcription subunit 18, fungi type
MVVQGPKLNCNLTFLRYVNQYVVEGHEFVSDNVILFLHRMRRFPDPSDLTMLDIALPPLNDMPFVDPSRSWLLQVSLALIDGASPRIVAQGLSEIETVRTRLRGIVDLSIPDRLSMDTRSR